MTATSAPQTPPGSVSAGDSPRSDGSAAPTAAPRASAPTDALQATGEAVGLTGATAGRVRRSGRLSRGIGLGLMVGAVLVLDGWALHNDVLKGVVPGRVGMNPVTALCFLLCGAALWLVSPTAVRPWRKATTARHSASAAAFVVLALAGLRLIAYATHWDTPVDRLLFARQLGLASAAPVRMAPNTALCFLLTALALLLTARSRPTRHRVAPLLALGTGAMALLAVTGYVYGVNRFYQVWTFIPMAVNTAAGFILLSVGVLAARPDREPVATVLGDTVGGVLARRLLPAALFVPLVLGRLCLWDQRGVDAFARDQWAFSLSLFTLATIAIFLALIWWTAHFLHRLDIDRRRSEQRLMQAEAVYQSLVETLPQNIFRKDLAGRFTFGNRNFCRELGRPIEEIRGRTDYDFFAEALAHRYRDDDQAVIDTGITFDKVEEHVVPGGATLYVQVMKTPVRDATGRTIGVQGIFWDVSDRVRAETELASKNEQLEETNQMLKQAVLSEREAHEALKKAQSQLVQSEKLVGLGQMVAGVAHEINNPLAFVSNNVAVLQRDVAALLQLIQLYQQGDADLAERQPALGAEIRDFAEQIDLPYTISNLDELLTRSRDGLRRIQQIVRDLRDFARLDESTLQEADLNAGVESTLNIIHGHAKKKQITLEKQLSPLPPVACQAAKINQVIMNLAVNAIDASHEGGTVTVRTGTGEAVLGDPDDGAAPPAPVPVVRIEVVDQGTGIDSAFVQRIFDPFFTTKPVGQGTGLGLSISYGIVRDHGGKIEVDTEPGRGSTFRVILPIDGRMGDEINGGRGEEAKRREGAKRP